MIVVFLLLQPILSCNRVQSGVFRVLSRFADRGAELHWQGIVGSELPSVCIPVLVHESPHACVSVACASPYDVQTGQKM